MLPRCTGGEPKWAIGPRPVMEHADGRLWSLAADGDPAAFGELYDRHHRAVYNYLFRRTASWDRAEELTSVVFLEAWRRRRRADIAGSALPWLLGVAHNVVRNEWRSTRRHGAALRRFPQPRESEALDEVVVARIDAERRMHRVLALVSRLPERERAVLELVAWAGLSYESAATALGVPVGTVRSRLSRARARLNAPDAELQVSGGHDTSGSARTTDSAQELHP